MGEGPEVSLGEGSIVAALDSELPLDCVHQGQELSNELLSLMVLLLNSLGPGVPLMNQKFLFTVNSTVHGDEPP